jgi:hypothetical protein
MTLPTRPLMIPSGAVGVLFLPVYLGIVLPAMWSAKPARRKASADVLRQAPSARTGRKR